MARIEIEKNQTVTIRLTALELLGMPQYGRIEQEDITGNILIYPTEKGGGGEKIGRYFRFRNPKRGVIFGDDIVLHKYHGIYLLRKKED